MTNYTVSDTPVQVQQSVASGWTLQNTGTNPIYLGNDLSVTSASGYIVLPGVAIPIQMGTVLYAVCAPGLPSTISTVQGVQAPTVSNVEINGPVTASIPGPVTVSGTVDANITSGSVAITGTVNATINSGTVNVGNTVTTRGASSVISSTSQNSTVGSNVIGNFSGLTPYATLAITINQFSPGGGAVTTCNQLRLDWQSTVGNFIYSETLACSTTGALSAIIPVRSDIVQITWLGGGSGPTALPVYVVGLPEVATRRVTHLYGTTGATSGLSMTLGVQDISRGMVAYAWNTINGQVPIILFPSRGGTCRFGFSNFDATAPHQFQIFDSLTNAVILRHTTAANTSDFELSVSLPEGPLFLQMNAAASAVYQEALTITWDPTS